jgi:hypothetical protein
MSTASSITRGKFGYKQHAIQINSLIDRLNLAGYLKANSAWEVEKKKRRDLVYS